MLSLADPDLSGIKVSAFWKPDVLAGSLDVRLSPLTPIEQASPEAHDIITLASLQTRRVLLETIDGARHILLNGHRFWIQLHCSKPSVIGECAHVGIRLNQTKYMKRSMDAAAQLLSLYRSEGGRIGLIGRRRNTQRLSNILTAYDIWHGFERPKGTLEDVARMLVGPARMAQDWGNNDRALKAQARRAIASGESFVASDYRKLLAQKTL
ncbi:MAG: DUF2285 domain-containing protein [Pseudomonadota bacterium]